MKEYFSVNEETLTDGSKVCNVSCPWMKIDLAGDWHIAAEFAGKLNKLLNDIRVVDVGAKE